MDRQLTSYLPPVLQNIREYRAVALCETPEIDMLWEACALLSKEPFVLEAGEYAIGRWEKLLDLHPRASQLLEERRFAVLSRLMEALPYTLAGLRRILDALCGGDGYSIELMAFRLSILLSLRVKNHVEEIEKLLERMLPANISLYLSLMYNRYSALKRLSYGVLSQRTYLSLQEEVLPAGDSI